MGGVMVIVLFGFVTAICANEIPASLGEEFCKEYPDLHLCRLQSTLEGALAEIQYLVNGETVASTSGTVSKRKSAFVRFGKRVDEEEDNEKRSIPNSVYATALAVQEVYCKEAILAELDFEGVELE
uniref:Uncharacterized protein n=1 Tax=Parascaris univalens TaxID=6257 RepID=A0A915CFR7_PARUN